MDILYSWGRVLAPARGKARRRRHEPVCIALKARRKGPPGAGRFGSMFLGQVPAGDSHALGALPIGLVSGVAMKRVVCQGEDLRQSDVGLDGASPAVRLRLGMEGKMTADPGAPTERSEAPDSENFLKNFPMRALPPGAAFGLCQLGVAHFPLENEPDLRPPAGIFEDQ